MANTLQYFFRECVTEAELNLGFALLEKADRDLAADIWASTVSSPGPCPPRTSPYPTSPST